jgi:hypothetical protein
MAHFLAYNTSRSAAPNTPLAANGTTTIGTVQTDIDGTFTYSCISDQAGTLFIEQSWDGTNWDILQGAPSGIAITANTTASGAITVLAPFLRVRYTNGATIQGFMRFFGRAFGTKTG